METARALTVLVDILGAASTSVVLGSKSEDSDPIIEGLLRICSRRAPLLLQREIIPGDPRTTEVFDVRKMVFDTHYAGAILDFRRDTIVPESGMGVDQIIERLGQWKKPISVTGTYSLEPGEDEGDEDDDEEDEDE